MTKRLLAVALILAFCAPLAHAGAEPVQVAVLRFLQRRADPAHAWLSAGLSHLLAGELSRRPGVVVVEREAVDHLLRELDLMESGVLASADATRVARVADADWGVLGTYAVEGADVDVEVSVVDAKSGAVLRSARERGTLPKLATLAARLADRVLGAAGLVEPARVPAVPVEAFAAYCEGLLAEQDGDYPRAFVGFSRALRAEPRFARAALDLGRLYSRMGEAEHAVVEWQRVIRTAEDPDVVVAAALLAAGALDRDLARPEEAADLLGDLHRRYPLHLDAWRFLQRAVDLRVQAGDPAGAVALLDGAIADARRRDEATVARIAALPSGSRSNAQHNRLIPRLNTAAALSQRHLQVWMEASLAGATLGDPPEGVFRVDEARPVVPIAATPPGRDPAIGDSRSWTLLAPPGRAVARVRLEAPATGLSATEPGKVTLSAVRWDSWVGNLDSEVAVPGGASAAMRLFASPQAASRGVFVWMNLRNGRMEAGTLHVELVPAPPPSAEHPVRPPGTVSVARAVRGGAQHPRLSRDAAGRLHAVFCDGDPLWASPRGGHSPQSPALDPDLWIATSVDEGRSFSAARRLSVSTDAQDVFPALLHGKDGRHRLVWVSNRNDPARLRLWYAESTDLVSWSFPRRVPLPHADSWEEGLYGTMGQTSATVAWPQLLEDDRGTVHLFVTLWSGPEGPGLYEVTTTDGLTWATPRRIVEGSALGSVARDGPDSFVCAARTEGMATALYRSDAGGPWRAGPAPPRESWVQPNYPLPSPILGVDSKGGMVLWDLVAGYRRRALFRRSTGDAWEGLGVTVEHQDPTDVLVLPDGTILTSLWEFGNRGEVLVHRAEARR